MTAKAQIAITIEVELPEPASIHPLKPQARQLELHRRAEEYAKGLTAAKLQLDLRDGRAVLRNERYHVVQTEIE